MQRQTVGRWIPQCLVDVTALLPLLFFKWQFTIFKVQRTVYTAQHHPVSFLLVCVILNQCQA